MADFSHENGAGIFPAIDTMAKDIGCSRRQIQYALKALEGCDLIVRERAGGKGVGNTNVWNINVELLVELACQNKALNGVHDKLAVVENEGANIAPLDLLRVQSAASRVQSATHKGAMGCTQTLINPYTDPLSASAGARDESRTPPALEKPDNLTKMLELTPQDAGWHAWMSELEKIGAVDVADEAIASGKLRVRHKWPDPENVMQGLIGVKPKQNIDITARMLGEGGATE